MQIPSTKTHLFAIYTVRIDIFIRWQHTMAIFTTLRLTVVLSTILPYTPDSYFTAINVGLLISSYPFPRPRLSPVIFPGQCRVFGRFSSFWKVFGLHRPALPPLRSRRLSSLLCVFLSASAWADILQRLCPLSSQRKPNSTSSPAPSS